MGAVGHTMPQPPQWAGLVRVSVSHPLSGLLSQSPKPPAQVPTTHTPARHAGVAPAGEGHRWPQAPQFSMSLSTRVSQPLSARMSQSAKPVAQAVIWQAPAAQVVAALGAAPLRGGAGRRSNSRNNR